MVEFKMPSLGAEMEAGTLIEWRIHAGDSVKRGDIVAVVDTDKAAVEVEIWESGVVEKLLVEPGRRVPVGTVLATLRGSGETQLGPKPHIEAETEVKLVKEKAPLQPSPALAPVAPSLRLEKGSRIRVSPVAKKRATELGVDLTTVQGTGPAGVITLADIEAKGVKPPGIIHPSEGGPLEVPVEARRSAMRATIAAAISRSKREIPHYYLSTQIDMHRVLEWLTVENLKRPVTMRLLYSVLLFKAVALALRKVPELNGFWKAGAFQPSKEIHIGVAISLKGGGLIAPALHDVGKKNLDDLMAELVDLVNRARKWSLRSSELSDPTITVTNLGEQGVETVFGIIYPPQVALIGFGNINQQPWVSENKVTIRPMITATLSADHRASDGHRGAVFLSLLARILREPEKL